jgi:hypothetical protein
MGFRDKSTSSSSSAAPQATKAPAKAGRYTGLKPAEGRSPFLPKGRHRVRFVETKEIRTKAKKPWLKTEVTILSSNNPEATIGQNRTIRKVISEEAFEMSGPEIVSMLMAALGYTSQDMAEFEEAFPNWGSMLDAVHGVPEACKEHGENPLNGMTAIVDGYETEPNDRGQVFVNCSWSPDPERAQD